MTQGEIEVKIVLDKIKELVNAAKNIEAKELALELLKEKAILEDKEYLPKVYNGLGIICRNLSDFSSALEYTNKALNINIEIGDKVGQAFNLGSIGIIYEKLYDYPKALEYYYMSLQIGEELGKKDLIGTNFVNIGIIYMELTDFPKALEYFFKALKIGEDIDKKVTIAPALANIGAVYTNLLDYTNALKYFNKSLEIFEELGDRDSIAKQIGNIGTVYSELKNFKKALENFEKALFLYEETSNRNGKTLVLGNIGQTYTRLANYPNAIEYLTKAYTLSKELDLKLDLKHHLIGFSELYEKIGDINSAFSFYKQYIEVKDSIESEVSKNKAQLFDQRRKIEEDEKARQLKLARFQEQEKILHNILPVNIADRILKQETFIADHFNSVSVLFMDIVGFTSLSSIAPPKQLVYLLDTIFTKADEILDENGLEKIKTIGDGYLAVANVTSPLEEHQKATAQAALQLLETMKDFEVNIPSDLGHTDWIKDMKELEIRIGIHTGEVVAGIIGKNKYTYDLWGDAVNIASRMESHSEPGRIHISEEFAKSIESIPEFSVIPRGTISIKGKGTMKTFWLEKCK